MSHGDRVRVVTLKVACCSLFYSRPPSHSTTLRSSSSEVLRGKPRDGEAREESNPPPPHTGAAKLQLETIVIQLVTTRWQTPP